MDIRATIASHKFATAVVVVAVTFVAHSLLSKPATQTSYVLATAQKGTLVVSVSGTGQVAVSDQLDVKPKASGDIVGLYVKAGQSVGAGAVLAQLDSTSARQAVRDAQISLQDAQISLQKLQLNQTTNVPNLQDSLAQTYQSAFSQVSTTFLSLPGIVDGARGILYDNTMNGACTQNLCEYGNIVSYGSSISMQFPQLSAHVSSDYLTAKTAFDTAAAGYQSATRDSSPDILADVLSKTLVSVRSAAQTVKDEQNMLDAIVADLNTQAAVHGHTAKIPAQITTYQSAISTYIGQLNGFINSLASIQSSLSSDEQSITTTQTGNPLDLASQQNSVEQRQAALANAQQTLADYTVRAPFAGVIAKVSVQKGDAASSGTAIATLITNQEIVQMSLNEVDVAHIAVGQKATLTFDAVPDLTLTGTVTELDTIGTVAQGVVNYGVQVTFDTGDARVRPGMSVSAAIVTEAKLDALMVPSSAVKGQGQGAYVQIPDATNPTAVPRQQTVVVGDSNDTMTEITSGLNEGDQVVTRTITAAATPTPARSSTVRIPGAGGGGFGGGALGR